ncbi:hypothetical protein BDZ90DRAFT_28258 [Jaminaea rosea]|uniref:SURP motif domain-containing protein n=1 Tax=Jaminaea rosea TaxID=1569628 RepID=A0A316V057_9BASI|nr:hypothetical protein BDZ90DRAFT_28258 [Jaminaea rosea]PWN30926.1 hypothetical protein BDZ90DRAFT_28258 [Jaminaea rosea]
MPDSSSSHHSRRMVEERESFKRPRYDDGCRYAAAGPSSSKQRRVRAAEEDMISKVADNLLPPSDAFENAAAARAADPLGLNQALWEKGWEGGRLYADRSQVDDQDKLSPHPSDEEGASDFSDAEERAAYISVRRAGRIERQNQQRKRELEERRLARMQAIEAADPSASGASSTAFPWGEPVPLTKSTFDLMLRTATAVGSSAKPKQLELRILTHHGRDERFAFLRKEGGGRANEIWERLKAGEKLSWEDVDPDAEVKREGKDKEAMTGLLSGYDSDDGSEDNVACEVGVEKVEVEAGEDVERKAEQATAASALGEYRPAGPVDFVESKPEPASVEEAEQKARDRIARARQWASQQREAKQAASAATGTKA